MTTPPRWLFHGTASEDVPSILKQGLIPSLARDARDLDPPRGVWLTANYRYAELVATQGGRRAGTVLVVDGRGLDLIPFGPLTWLALTKIKAKRISRA